MDLILFDSMLDRLFDKAGQVNFSAVEKDLERNHVHYGYLLALADMLRELGHEVEVTVRNDTDVLEVPKISINGEVYYAEGM